MPYSQKYTIVHFLKEIDEGASFDMQAWPLHVTLADVFAVEMSEQLIQDIQNYIDVQPLVVTRVKGEHTLGTTDVWLLDTTPSLQATHGRLVDILEKHGATFNSPEFTRQGFLPHITKQPGTHMEVGDKIRIDSLTLIDMFPEQDWQQRKVLKTFHM